MRVPAWAMAVLLAALIAACAWAITDRLAVGERLKANEVARQNLAESIGDIKVQLARIENKLDRYVERK